MKKLFFIAIAVLSFTAVSFGQNADAKATIQASHSVTKVSDLNFGSFALSGGSGTIVVSTAGVATDFEGIAAEPTGVSASSFSISGGGGETFYVTLPGELVISIAGSALPNRTMQVNTWTTNVGQTALTTSNIADFTNILVGGTLNFDGNEIPGDYRGTYAITVNWN